MSRRLSSGIVMVLMSFVIVGAWGGDLTFELDQKYDLPSSLQPQTASYAVRLGDIDLDGSLDLLVEDSSFIGAHNLADNRTIVSFPKLTDNLTRRELLGHLDTDTIVDYLLVCVQPQSGSDQLQTVQFLSSRNYQEPDTLVLQGLIVRDWKIDSLFLGDADNDGSVELYGTLSYPDGQTTETLNFGHELDGPTPIAGPLPLDTSALGRAYQLYGDGVSYASAGHEGGSCLSSSGVVCADTGLATFRTYDHQGIEVEQVFQSPLNCGGPGENLLRGRYADIRDYVVGDVLSSSSGAEAVLHVEYQTWVYNPDSSLVCGTISHGLQIWDMFSPGQMNLIGLLPFPHTDAHDAMYFDPRFSGRILLAGNLDDPGGAFFYLHDLNWHISVDTIQADELEGDILDYRPLRNGDDPSLITIDSLGTVRLFRILAPTAVREPGRDIVSPSGFALGRPYPNPFNSSATVPLMVERKGELLVEVVNLLGRRVTTLLKGVAEPGRIMLEWDASNVASGVYFLRVSDQHHSSTAKMVLMK